MTPPEEKTAPPPAQPTPPLETPAQTAAGSTLNPEGITLPEGAGPARGSVCEPEAVWTTLDAAARGKVEEGWLSVMRKVAGDGRGR